MNPLRPFDGAYAPNSGCAYLPVYFVLEPSENVEPLLSGGVVDERREDYQRLARGGGGIDSPINHPERQENRNKRHQDDDGSRYPDTQTPATEKGARGKQDRFFGQSHGSGRDRDYLGGDEGLCRGSPGYGLYGGRLFGSGRIVGRESGGEKELAALFGRQSEQFGAAKNVLPVSGTCGDALFPANKGGAADRDSARKFGVADAGPLHVQGQKFSEGWQLLQLRYTEFTECDMIVVRSVHHPMRF